MATKAENFIYTTMDKNGIVDCMYSEEKLENQLTTVSKKDKRKQHIGLRLAKLDGTLEEDKNELYRALLHGLQMNLAALQQGTNPEYLQKKTELEELRDYELTRLRLWEEYQVKRVETEYNEDVAKAKERYDTMIKLLKEKFYDKLQRQVRQLKEDKLLLNLVNATLWSTGGRDDTVNALRAATGSSSASNMNINDRRLLRKREIHSRFTSAEADELLDSAAQSGAGRGSSAGYQSASKRRRHYATRYSSNDESSGMTSATNSSVKQNALNGALSGNDSNLSEKDYDELNHLIMNNDDGVILHRTSPKPNTRGAKQFLGVQGLKVEELNEDLTLLRSIKK